MNHHYGVFGAVRERDESVGNEDIVVLVEAAIPLDDESIPAVD